MARATFQFYCKSPRPHTHREPGSALTIRWRLLAGNRRELSRSTGLFPDHDAGMASVNQLLAEFHLLQPRLSIHPATSQWTWDLIREGDVVATSARPYARRVECRMSVQQFLVLAPLASIEAHVRIYGPGRCAGVRR